MTESFLFFVRKDQIVIPAERQRKSFPEAPQVALTNSIREHKLIHPLLVEPAEEDGKWNLIAGQRRFRSLCSLGDDFEAMPKAPRGMIPVTTRRGLSETQRFALELEENIQRENLPWPDQSAAIVRLHKLRQQQHGTQKIVETMQEARVGQNTVIDSLLVMDHIEKNPDLAKAKSLPEAAKIVRKSLERAHRATLAEQYDLTKAPTPHRFELEDAQFFISELDSGTIDIICTDPPYFIGADKFGEQATTAHEYDDSEKGFNEWKEWFPYELKRVAKPTAWCYVFCDDRRYPALNLEFTLAGWTVWPHPLIWNKMGTGMLPLPKKGPRRTYESILFAYCGDGEVVRQAAPDVLSYPPPQKLLHAAQKPAPLLVDLLSRVALPGAQVLDLYAGSGSIFLACNACRCIAKACENDKATFATAAARIGETVEQDVLDLSTVPSLVI